MIPITRIDEYLAVISQDEDATGLPDQAVTRIDTYLSKIAGEAVAELPEPVTRIDRYLASIAGMDVVMYDPITRIDYYLATVAGVYSGELPEPVTRIDHYLYNWAEGGSLPWQTFTGNPLQFTAPKAHVLKSVKASFSPIQSGSGDPSPDNVRPISGWTALDVVRAGENLWDEEWELGSITWGTGANAPSTSRIRSKNYIPVLEQTSYHLECAEKTCDIYFYDDSKNWISQQMIPYTGDGNFTTPNGTKYVRFTPYATYGTTYNHDISINYPSTDTEYHPTKGISTTTLSFPQTVYGGTAEVAEDGTGTGSGTWSELLDLGDLDWEIVSGQTHVFRTKMLYGHKTVSGINYVCSAYKSVNSSTLVGDMPNNSCKGNATDYLDYSRYFYIRDDNYSDAPSFKTAMSGVMLSYELATPVPFTPTVTGQPTAVKGINTMWTDGDTLTVEAKAEAVNLSALQSLNMLLGGRYYNNGTADEPTDEEALNILLGGNTK